MLRILIYAILVLLVSPQKPADSGTSACGNWSRLASQLSNAHTTTGGAVRMSCDNNGTICETLRCRGNIHEAVLGMTLDSNFCFGVILNHCEADPSIDFYVSLTGFKNFSTQQHIHNSTKIQTPLTFGYKEGQATVYIFVNMSRPDLNHLTFSASGKIYVKFGLFEDWPEGLERVIIPPQTIQLSNCNKTTGHPPPVHFDHYCVGSNLPTLPSTTINPVTPNSTTFGKPCDLAEFHSCGDNEVCTVKADKSGNATCECYLGLHLNKFGLCGNATAKPTVSPGKPQAPPKKKSGMNIAVIGGACAGGVVLILIIIGGVVIIRRRKRQMDRYSGRQLLLTSEDDDDDDQPIRI